MKFRVLGLLLAMSDCRRLSVVGVLELASLLVGLVDGNRKGVLKIRLQERGRLGAVGDRAGC